MFTKSRSISRFQELDIVVSAVVESVFLPTDVGVPWPMYAWKQRIHWMSWNACHVWLRCLIKSSMDSIETDSNDSMGPMAFVVIG